MSKQKQQEEHQDCTQERGGEVWKIWASKCNKAGNRGTPLDFLRTPSTPPPHLAKPHGEWKRKKNHLIVNVIWNCIINSKRNKTNLNTYYNWASTNNKKKTKWGREVRLNNLGIKCNKTWKMVLDYLTTPSIPSKEFGQDPKDPPTPISNYCTSSQMS